MAEYMPCPAALHGVHGKPNASGRCPYCGHHLGRSRAGGRGTRSLSDDVLEPELRRRQPRPEQDPLEADMDTETRYYKEE